MSVRQSLLAILDQGPCYGYQLRAEFDRRTGSTWPLNVGQIYNTLDRLERDGLVAKGDTDAQGHVYYADHGCRFRRGRRMARLPRRARCGARATSSRSSSRSPRRFRASTSPPSSRRSASVSRSRRDALDARRGASIRTTGRKELAWCARRGLDDLPPRPSCAGSITPRSGLARHPQHAMALELATERPKRGRPGAGTGGDRLTADATPGGGILSPHRPRAVT